MKDFWLGVLAGMAGTLLLCAMLGFTFKLLTVQHTKESFDRGEFPPRPPIVMHGFFSSRGEFGVIDEINDQTLTLQTREGNPKTIRISDETQIYRGKTKIAASELSKGQRIMVIASPQADGTLKAKFVRVVSASMFIIRKSADNG